MSQLEVNIKNTPKVPISRNNLFYDESSFQYEMMIGKNYLEQDVNQTVVLFQIDIEKSNLDAVYNESKKDSLVFKPPVELHCIYTIEDSSLKGYEKGKNLGVYVQQGKLNFGVYQATLDELGADIKIGDYVGVQVTSEKMVYWVVVNDGRNNYNNAKSVFGYKNPWRQIECAHIDENEFNG